ncbi:MAG: class I SAM-dependent methyltransferase [Sphingobacteriales bacterium]|nr:MAG: class I SAM-dependent methyltransferase [Sphingobacteriales bacterium]
MAENYVPFFAANKDLWNKKTLVHKDSDFYDLASFKQGKPSLNSVELAELGDVSGKSLLHLQCHFGIDTLSLAKLGAKCTGADISDESILLARSLNKELGLDAEFICSNIYDLKENLDQKFDIVFTSYGTIGWLPDLDKWAGIINHFLKPGGIFYMVDFHPIVWMFDNHFIKFEYSYFNFGVIVEETSGTYADRNAEIKQKEYGWNHPLSEIISALRNAGLQIDFLHEHDYSPYNCFNNTVEIAEDKWQIQGLEGKIPMLYSIKTQGKNN